MHLSPTTHPATPKRVSKVRQACDGCRTRKVRCDGRQPCVNCMGEGSECTFLAVPKKTGPKGRRKPRPTAADGGAAAYFSTSVPSTVRCTLQLPQIHQENNTGSGRATLPPSSIGGDGSESPHIAERNGFRLSPRVTHAVMAACLDAFFTHKYPITPILDRKQVRHALPHLRERPELYGMITACCAVMVLSPDIIVINGTASAPSDPPTRWQDSLANNDKGADKHDIPSADFLISETIRARNFCDSVEHPSLTTIQTSFFLFSAFFCLGKDTSAWHYIREAITTLQSLRLHEEATYDEMTDPTMALYGRRLFWVLFITERAYALQRHRPLTLQSAIKLPYAADESRYEASILPGLLDLISLFRNFDTEFITMWNVSNSPPNPASQHHLAKLQKVLELALPRITERTAIQQADLLLSREWLKLVVWQLCVSKTLLCSASPEESMSLRFPISVARNVVTTTSALPESALEANGVGILEKIFDVGCSLADVLALKPSCLPRTALQVGPTELLREIVHIVGTYIGGSPRHWRVLAAKAEESLRSATMYVMAEGERHMMDFEGGNSSGVVEEESDDDL